MAKVLIVDDDRQFCQMLSQLVSHEGHEAVGAHSLSEAEDRALAGPFEAVFLDVHLPDGNGLDFIPQVRNWPGEPEVIIITGAGQAEGAEMAIASGAWDYLAKGSTVKAMSLPLRRVMKYREEKAAHETKVAFDRKGIVGDSASLRGCLDVAARASGGDAGVLISGETGTGKELLALAIHRNSRRSSYPFVVVDCAALPEQLIESTLFGHVKGAFTGADAGREGLIKKADQGTLFLDEIGELPPTSQRSFLRVLEERRFRPVGSNREIGSDFRVIAATNRNLDRMVAQKEFRKDLLFRLRSFSIHLPPLRARMEDVNDLVRYCLNRHCRYYGVAIKGFSPEFLECLMAYEWPGNVRELNNSLERAVSFAMNEPTLYPKHLPSRVRLVLAKSKLPGRSDGLTRQEQDSGRELPDWREFRRQGIEGLERDYVERLMARTNWDMGKACALAGLGRSSLYTFLKKYQIRRPD